jgi:DNA-binding transcriptional LysR family regulator
MDHSDEHALPDWGLLASWVAVVESGSVSDAGRRLHISQAAVSQRIKQLESIFSTALLDRSTRPAQPTAAGQRLFENAKDLLTRADQMMEGVRNVSRAKRMVVRFGCVDSFAATLGPLLIKALSGASHQIRLWSGISPNLEQLIESRQLDLAITTAATAAPGMTRAQLFNERFYVVLPASFDVDRFATLLELGRHLQFIRYSARSLIGQQVDQYLERMGDALERTCEFDATDPLLSLVGSGVGFALTTPLCLWQSRHFIPSLRVVSLSSFTRHGRPYPDLTRGFHLAYRQGELGSLPTEVKDLVRMTVRRQISAEIGTALGLEKDVLWTPSDGE